MKKILLYGVAALLVLFAGGLLVSKQTSLPLKLTNENVKVYCSADGKLSAAQSIQSHRSYCIKPEPTGGGYAQKTPVKYSFSIVDDSGNTLKDFQTTHTRQLHLMVASHDLAQFQHVHPDLDQATGVFTMYNLTFPTNGPYRIFADFAAAGAQVDSHGMPLTSTPWEDVEVGNANAYTPVPLGSEETKKTFDGYEFALSTHGALTTGTEAMLTFNVKQGSNDVTYLEPYLGALGHSVILREGTLEFIHAHPVEDLSAKQNGTVNFMVDFPEGGKYKVFTQFQIKGKVVTTNFVVSVEKGSTSTNNAKKETKPSAPSMMH